MPSATFCCLGAVKYKTAPVASKAPPATNMTVEIVAKARPFAFHLAYEHDAPLAGEFQRHNVALAVRAAEELRPLLPRITAASIEHNSLSRATSCSRGWPP